jgi:hypothetical protein
MKVRYLDKGSLEERVNLVCKCLILGGWEGRSNETYGAHLIELSNGEILIIPPDVMEHLIDHDMIWVEREN